MNTIKISEKSQDLIIKVIVIILLYVIFAKPIFNKLGITKSNADRIRDREIEKEDSPFKMSYWKKYFKSNPPVSGGGNRTVSTAEEKRLKGVAFNIYTAFGLLTDDEAKVVGAFYSLKTKSAVSMVALYFYQLTKGKDLLTYLGKGQDTLPQNGLSDDDLSIIINYVNKLPNY